MNLSFDYVNWRGRNHRYVIEPERIEFAFVPFSTNIETWVLHGMVVTRDDDPRPGMSNRRRTFLMSGLRNIRTEPRSK